MLNVKYFSTEWCGPCKSFYPVFTKVLNEYGIQHTKVSLDESNRDLALKYGVSKVPTIVVEQEGAMTKRFVGVMSENELKKWVTQI
jgi:thioredoxin-like negative regulator of GroEL